MIYIDTSKTEASINTLQLCQLLEADNHCHRTTYSSTNSSI